MFLRDWYLKFVGLPDDGIFRELPLDLPNRVFTSPMPFGAYDKRNCLLKLYEQAGVKHVFMFVTDEEIKKKTRKNLKEIYTQHGLDYPQCVIKDFEAPDLNQMVHFVQEAVVVAQNKQIALHCHAGVGRTAVAATCLVIKARRCTVPEAIAHVKAHMCVNMTSEQKRVIQNFADFLINKVEG